MLRMRRRELLLLLSASMALAACGSLANLMAPKPWRTALIADSAPLPNAPRPVMPMTAAHSHNDYEQRRPLLDALALGYRSVEADIWLRDSELWVSHKGRSLAGTLRELYLDPLQDRADRNRLRALVDAVHRLGRRLRLYHLPEAEGVWSEALDAGVDLLSTDELQRLEQFLEARPLDGARAALQ